jgi:hypothetical protein
VRDGLADQGTKLAPDHTKGEAAVSQ